MPYDIVCADLRYCMPPGKHIVYDIGSGILYTWTRRYVLVQTRTYLSQYQLRHFCTDWYVLVCTDTGNSSYSTYVSVPVCTALVQGSTRRYKAVPSGTKEVQGGTKQYQHGSEQYRQVHTGTYWSDVTQYVQVRTALFWSFCWTRFCFPTLLKKIQ